MSYSWEEYWKYVSPVLWSDNVKKSMAKWIWNLGSKDLIQRAVTEGIRIDYKRFVELWDWEIKNDARK